MYVCDKTPLVYFFQRANARLIYARGKCAFTIALKDKQMHAPRLTASYNVVYGSSDTAYTDVFLHYFAHQCCTIIICVADWLTDSATVRSHIKSE